MKSCILIAIIILSTFNLYPQTKNKLYPISNGSKYGLINRNKDTIAGYIYDYVSSFKNGYAIIQKENKYGMINYLGVETITPIYDKIDFLKDGLTVVSLNDSSTVVDTLGNNFTKQWYYQVDTPLNNIFRVIKKINYGAGPLIRNTIKYYHLEEIIGLSRDSVLFSDMLIGYVSRQNNPINGLWFSGGEKFENGKAKIAISKHTYFLDDNGNITPRVADACDLSLMNIFIPDEYPEYPGGNDELYKFLNDNLVFPENIDVSFNNGEVLVSFIIDKTGSVGFPKIEKSLHPAFDAEVLSVINKLGKWQPAKYNEKPTCWQLKLPFRFMGYR